MDDERSQSQIIDFFDGNLKKPFSTGKKRVRDCTRNEMKRHLEEFFRLLLKSTKRNSVELQRVLAYINVFLRETEEKGIFYLKTMSNGKRRIFKKCYCCFDPETWKKCPEYRCPAWPCYSDFECPHNPYGDEATAEFEDAIEVK